MAKLFERKSTSLTISEFYDNYVLNKYRFNISYQRKSGVWSEDKKSFLIDSIMKNYPVPAIFLRPCVDTNSGKTVYDVVDGRQRLESIIDFIENKIPLTTYFAEDDFIDDTNLPTANEIAGLTFDEIKEKNTEFPDYIKQFWTYALNIEYLYEQREELVASVFDRLNRNGEPLTRQELRNARYSSSIVLATIKELTSNPFWTDKLARLKSVRMEDIEFISELFFLVAEDKILESSDDILDDLYEKYKYDEVKINDAKKSFVEILSFMSALNLNASVNKRLYWITHLYTLFSAAWKWHKTGVQPSDVEGQLRDFYAKYFSKDMPYEEALGKYKTAASSRTGSAGQRRNRLDALLEYCENRSE